jgi:hypothetical protein
MQASIHLFMTRIVLRGQLGKEILFIRADCPWDQDQVVEKDVADWTRPPMVLASPVTDLRGPSSSRSFQSDGTTMILQGRGSGCLPSIRTEADLASGMGRAASKSV